MARHDAEFCRVLAEDIKEIAILSLDTAGIINACNRGAEILLEYAQEELIGKHISEIYTPAEAQAGLPEYRARATHESQVSDVLLKRKDGSLFHAHCILAPVPAKGGGIRGYVKVLRDDTERKLFEQMLMWNRIFAEGIVDSVREPLMVIDAKLKIIKINRAFSRMFNGAATSAEGVELCSFQNGAWNDAALLSKIREILENDSSFEDYVMEREFDGLGKRILRLSGTRLYCEGTRTEMVLLTIHDFTDRKRLEDDLHERVEQLNMLDRRKDNFLATLAHELRSPLAPIRSAVNVLLLNRAPEPSSQRATVIIERQVNKMARLVEDLLDIARIQQDKIELHREFLDLKAVIGSAVESTESLIRSRRHTLKVLLPAEPIYVMADPTRLEQILINLISNAAKYTMAGGHIQVQSFRKGDDVIISVLDSGIGIAPEMLPHVFDIFAQARRIPEPSQGGLGLGLALVHRLVKLHGGYVEAKSQGLGKGAEFVVALPAANGEAPAQPVRASQSETAAPRQSRRVLLIEDDDDAREAMRTLLSLLGHETEEASNGIDGIAKAHTFKPEVAIVDIGLPEMSGYEVAGRLRQDVNADMLLIALTGFGQPGDRKRALDAGFDVHLVKPIGVAELSAALARQHVHV